MKNKILSILEYALIIFGVVILCYPFVRCYFSEKQQLKAVQEYKKSSTLLDENVVKQQKDLAESYNNCLSGADVHDPFVPGSGIQIPDNYYSVLNIYDKIMGSIVIPKIKVNLPIYHGVDEQDLKRGAGHLMETAFPIGGEGNHSVICAHRALPTAKLFTDLDKLEIGDKFYIDILNERHTYVVDKISVVEPGDTSKLKAEKGKDYITLLTCTPYGINSHRLLVRGIRGKDEKINDDNTYKSVTTEDVAGTSGLTCIIVIIISVSAAAAVLIVFKRKRK